MKKPRFTETQGRYLAFLHAYTAVHAHAPSEEWLALRNPRAG
ncbi:hypothetical protein ACSRUE_07545 [Sorangium sp. KYC3313]